MKRKCTLKEEEKKIMNEKQIKWKSQTMLFLISQCITLFGSTLVQMAIVWYWLFRILQMNQLCLGAC